MSSVLHISHTFGVKGAGGAAVAATLRFLDDRRRGEDAWFACVEDLAGDTERVVKLPRSRIQLLWYHLMAWRINRWLMRLFNMPMDISLGLVSVGLKEIVREISPTHVFIHWIGRETLRYEELLCLLSLPTKVRVTVILHDFSLVETPQFRKATCIDRWVLRRIRKVLERLPVDFEAPSQWAAKHIRDIWPNASVIVRPTIVNFDGMEETKIFRHGIKRLLFGCHGGRKNPYKGFADLEKALALLPEDVKRQCELHVFGESAEECETAGVKTVFHGSITNREELFRLYRSSDALVFPSISETQGLVKCEALACGLKVVAFNRAACAEGIDHMANGFVANTVEEFSQGIEWCLTSKGAK